MDPLEVIRSLGKEHDDDLSCGCDLCQAVVHMLGALRGLCEIIVFHNHVNLYNYIGSAMQSYMEHAGEQLAEDNENILH